MNDKIYIIIPALNEEKIITEVIKEINEAGYNQIIVIDDGSTDDTFNKAKSVGARVLRHKINRGKGAAVKTGIEAAKIIGADIAVTIDGDGQHNPADIKKMVNKIRQGSDVVLGSRLKNREEMPKLRVIYNFFGNLLTWYLHGLWVTDSQSGLRAYSRKALELIDTKSDRYEYDSEIIREIYRNKLKFTEIPIEVRYTEYSMGKTEKQGFLNGLKTVYKMIWNLIS
ncbi:MAG: glycosyltransferase family 2 protein [Candidatus Moraniibacteriota bacterium]